MQVTIGEIKASTDSTCDYQVPVSFLNTSDRTLKLNGAFGITPYIGGLVVSGGKSVMASYGPAIIGGEVVNQGEDISDVSLAPGETWSENVPLHIPSACLTRQKNNVLSIGLMIDIWAGASPESFEQKKFYEQCKIQMPTPSLDWLVTDYGAQSRFYRKDGQVFFSAPYQRDTAICADTKGIRALCPDLLLNGKTIHYGVESKKRTPKGELRGVNGVFYRTDEDIWTLQGPAKIKDPASFEVLDDGGEVSSGHRSGFARDTAHVYHCDEMSDTRHAVPVKGCKEPAAFTLLGPGHFKDSQNVFWTWLKLSGADPNSFEALNYTYGRDNSGIWYMNTRLENVDVQSFKLIHDPNEHPGFHDDLGGWGQDKQGWIYCGDRVEPEG